MAQKEFDGVIKRNFLGNGTPKENMHYTSIACITIDSVMRISKKNYLQVYLEECKYRVKKIQMFRFFKHWARFRFRVRFRSRVKIWHWIDRFRIIVIFLLIDGCFLNRYKNLPAIFTGSKQSKTPFERNSLTYGTPCHARGCFVFLLSPCYLQDTMPCQWSSSDLPWVLRIWERIFYSQAFFALHSFPLVLRPPQGR